MGTVDTQPYITIFYVSGFFDPVSQVPHKVKEKVAIWHADNLREKERRERSIEVCEVYRIVHS